VRRGAGGGDGGEDGGLAGFEAFGTERRLREVKSQKMKGKSRGGEKGGRTFLRLTSLPGVSSPPL